MNIFQRYLKAFPADSVAIGLLLLGGIFRMIGLGSSAFWFDESYSLYLGNQPTMLFGIQWEFGNYGGPLWNIVIWITLHLFGVSEVSLRLPSLIFGLASLYLAWKIIKQICPTPASRVAAAAFCAFLPYLIWTSQDGRCYAFFILLYLSSFWFILNQRWLGLTACVGLLLYTHPTAIFYAVSLFLPALILHRSSWHPVFMSFLAGGLSYAPWIPSLLSAPKLWGEPLTLDRILNALEQAMFATSLSGIWHLIAYLAIFFTLILSIIVSVQRTTKDPQVAAVILWAITPLVIMIMISSFQNVINYRIVSAMIVPIALLWAITLFPRRMNALNWLLPATWAILLVIGLINWSPASRGGELRELAQVINTHWQPGDVIYHVASITAFPFSLYTGDHPGYMLDEDLRTIRLQNIPLEKELGFKFAALEKIPHQRAWIIYARDQLLPPRAKERMDHYVQGAIKIGTVHYMQAAPIDVYLQENK